MLSCVFASALTAGLTHFMNRRLHRCNGQQAHAAVFPFTQVSSGGRRRSTHRFTEVRNLFHLASLLDAETASTIWFELDDDDVIEDDLNMMPYSTMLNSEVITESGEMLGRL